MLRKLYLVPVLALLALPALSQAQFEAGNWEMTLAGQGSNDKDFRTVDLSAQVSLGYFLTKELEISVREGLTYADGGSSWILGSFGALDYHFDLDRWQPFVGVNGGKNCGSSNGGNINDDFFAGPEVGVKYFVNATTFVELRGAYEFDIEEGIDTGEFQYTLALGFKW